MNMLYEMFRRLLYPMVVVTVVGTLWVVAWSHSLVNEAYSESMPALFHPIASATR